MSPWDLPVVNRRHLLAGSAGALVLGAAAPASARSAPAQTRRRLTMPSGVQTGDVTTRSGVLWARASGEGRLMARLDSGRRRGVVRGPWATPGTDFTARIDLDGLAPGREYDAELWFESPNGTVGEVRHARFSTASVHPAATSFVWTGDTAGQGWGINPDLGGMTTYATMHATRPDFFIHAGDTIYADGPLAETVTEPDGQVWRNLVTPEVSKVAESLEEFRGRHRYNLMDHNIRSFYADVPVISQWDDHETHNNWFPGQSSTTSATPSAGSTYSPAGRAGPGRSSSRLALPTCATAAAAGSPRRASTARSSAARTWTCSAWTCATGRAPTRQGPRRA